MKTSYDLSTECHDLINECMSYGKTKTWVYRQFAQRMKMPEKDAHISKMATIESLQRARGCLGALRNWLEQKHRRKVGYFPYFPKGEYTPKDIRKAIKELNKKKKQEEGIARMVEHNRIAQEEAMKRRIERPSPHTNGFLKTRHSLLKNRKKHWLSYTKKHEKNFL